MIKTTFVGHIDLSDSSKHLDSHDALIREFKSFLEPLNFPLILGLLKIAKLRN